MSLITSRIGKPSLRSVDHFNNAINYENRSEWAKAEALFRRSLAIDTMVYQANIGLARALVNEGKVDEASQVLDAGSRRLPRLTWLFGRVRTGMLWANGRVDSAAKNLAAAAAEAHTPAERAQIASIVAYVAVARGKLGEGERLTATASALDREAGRSGLALADLLRTVVHTAWYRGDRAGAAKQLDDALKAIPVASLAPLNRPFRELADAQVIVGRVDGAKATLADFEKTWQALGSVPDTNERSHIEGTIAIAEKKYDLAAAKFREKSIDNGCRTCDLPQLAQAYDLAGKPDSAIAVYERYAQDKHLNRLRVDATFLGPSLKRLGELYEAKGDRDNAAKHYDRFVELWKGADPELQPALQEVQGRLAKLRSAEPARR